MNRNSYAAIWETEDGRVLVMTASTPISLMVWLNDHEQRSLKDGVIVEDVEVDSKGIPVSGEPYGRITRPVYGSDILSIDLSDDLMELYMKTSELLSNPELIKY